VCCNKKFFLNVFKNFVSGPRLLGDDHDHSVFGQLKSPTKSNLFLLSEHMVLNSSQLNAKNGRRRNAPLYPYLWSKLLCNSNLL